MSLGSQIIYKQLFQRHGLVRIPIIQRDYAQGRPDEMEVREEFLNSLKEALQKPANDPELPLNLDFIYGSVEGDGDTRFLPLDGQQRLTTLFLLHWYLAWRDNQWEEFRQLFQDGLRSRFSYSVRPSSNEFFDELVGYHPNILPDDIPKIAQHISDQPWYFRSWRLDPTIQSVLGMLEAIHNKFSASTGLFLRLIDQDQPAITFQLLDLKNFGLSDDLYIKMNARGKPLSQFENFKARYELELESQFRGVNFKIGGQNLSVAKYVALKMDNAWTDLFWRLRDRNSNLYDGAIMNMFRLVALVTRDPDDSEYLKDFSRLRHTLSHQSYSDFHARGWLDESFTLTIIHLFDAWSMEEKKFSALLPDNRYFDEKAIFNKVVTSVANLSNADIVQFAAYTGFVKKHQEKLDATAFQEWMRIIHNLSANTEYNRPDDIRRSIFGINQLLEHSQHILKHLAESDDSFSGFNMQQINEEKLKAELILSDSTWRPLIDQAEAHAYFRGQIEFLLDFSGVTNADSNLKPYYLEAKSHIELKASFSNYLALAQQMFNALGLCYMHEFLWQRAMLSIGDYLLPSRRNRSFLTNSITDQASWKRLLRGTGDKVPRARKILQQLWDKLNPNLPLESQLKKVIDESNHLESWRAALVQTPKAFEYCKNQSLRFNSETDIYLLSKTQMNGAHAELFTFCLYYNLLVNFEKDGRLKPLKLSSYHEAVGNEYVPGIQLTFVHKGNNACFELEFQNEGYLLYAHNEHIQKWPELIPRLMANGFAKVNESVSKSISYENMEKDLLQLAQMLTSAFPSTTP